MSGRKNAQGKKCVHMAERFIIPPPEPSPSSTSRRKYFTTSQIMQRWGVSAMTVWRLIDEGQLRGLKIRGVYRVDRESLESYERRVSF